MEIKYTPAPWSMSGNVVGKRIESDGQDDGFILAIAHIDMYDIKEECAGNKLLILAAPALLEALEELLNRYTGLINSGDAGIWNPEEEPEVIKARAAIKLARGE